MVLPTEKIHFAEDVLVQPLHTKNWMAIPPQEQSPAALALVAQGLGLAPNETIKQKIAALSHPDFDQGDE